MGPLTTWDLCWVANSLIADLKWLTRLERMDPGIKGRDKFHKRESTHCYVQLLRLGIAVTSRDGGWAYSDAATLAWTRSVGWKGRGKSQKNDAARG